MIASWLAQVDTARLSWQIVVLGLAWGLVAVCLGPVIGRWLRQ